MTGGAVAGPTPLAFREMVRALVFTCLAFLLVSTSHAELQTGLSDYRFENSSPAYGADEGPVILIHRDASPQVQRGSLEAFANLVRSDGFRVEWLDAKLDRDTLASASILVISNAYVRGGERDYRNFSVLDAPQVYSEAEIDLIEKWVSDGGSLLLLADHSPFAGGTISLAARFGFTYMTGHALRRDSTAGYFYVHMDFRKPDHVAPVKSTAIGLLGDHEITNGATGRPAIGHFYTFGGQAMIAPGDATVLLTIPDGFDALLSQDPRVEFYSAPRIDVAGFSQGAVKDLGSGRLAVFGEAGAFTAQQIEGREPFGLTHPDADQNADFVLATMRWLARTAP